LITIDMPVSLQTITGRRPADQAVSQAFGGQGCGTHSPNLKRPGPLGAGITQGFERLGYPVATTETPWAASMHLVEVYPHPALIRLLNAEKRVPYKVSKSSRYWPRTPIKERIGKLLEVFTKIHGALSLYVADIELKIPDPFGVTSLSSLKRYEDALDALICGWVGICYLAGSAVPFGDEHAAIWIPDKCDQLSRAGKLSNTKIQAIT
jgi:predicted RNase H-like nuclease